MESSKPKIIIVGGGAAGISAAYTILESSEYDVYLFEASDKLGGRARTDNSIKGFAFDMGPLYVQDPFINPWTKIAKFLDHKLIEESPYSNAFIRTKDEEDGWTDKFSTKKSSIRLQEIEQLYDGAKDSPNMPVTPEKENTLDDILAYGLSQHGPFTESAETWQYIAADKERGLSGDFGNNLFVEKGLGTLISDYGDFLSKKYEGRFFQYLSTPVKSIKYDTKGVVITTNKEEFKADACIVTVSTNVINMNKIEFNPELPEDYTTAFSLLPLGSYKKIAFKLNKEIKTSIEVGNNYYLVQEEPMGVWQYFRLSHSPDVLVVHTAGDFAATLDKMDNGDVFNLFKKQLIQAYPEEKIKDLLIEEGSLITNWTKDDFVLGAYSYTKFDGELNEDDETALNARQTISEPLKGRLYFAGEANNLEFYATIAGAHIEGEKAARKVLRKLIGKK